MERLKKYGPSLVATLSLVIVLLLVTGWGQAVAADIKLVFVTNDASHAVPVREQNRDANGNINVHEQGTATVAPQAATKHAHVFLKCINTGCLDSQSFSAVNASLITIHGGALDVFTHITLKNGSDTVFDSSLYPVSLGGDNIVLPLTQPLTVDGAELRCTQPCSVDLNFIGR